MPSLYKSGKHRSLAVVAPSIAISLLVVTGANAQPSPVRLITLPSVSQDDYPDRAIARELEGPTVVDIAVSSLGHAVGCTTVEVRHPGEGFEEATCGIWMRRARFVPARDAKGAPMDGTYRARMNWVLKNRPPVVATPVSAAPSSGYQSRIQTVRCDTGSGFYIWRVDWDNELITEVVSGIRLDIQDIESTSSSAGYIQAATDPDDIDNEIVLDLYFEESYDENDELVSTFTRQVVKHARGLGPSARINRYQGGCRPYRG